MENSAEKPFGTDPVNIKRFMAAAKKSDELKLTVMSGAQRRATSANRAHVIDLFGASQEW